MGPSTAVSRRHRVALVALLLAAGLLTTDQSSWAAPPDPSIAGVVEGSLARPLGATYEITWTTQSIPVGTRVQVVQRLAETGKEEVVQKTVVKKAGTWTTEVTPTTLGSLSYVAEVVGGKLDGLHSTTGALQPHLDPVPVITPDDDVVLPGETFHVHAMLPAGGKISTPARREVQLWDSGQKQPVATGTSDRRGRVDIDLRAAARVSYGLYLVMPSPQGKKNGPDTLTTVPQFVETAEDLAFCTLPDGELLPMSNVLDGVDPVGDPLYTGDFDAQHPVVFVIDLVPARAGRGVEVDFDGAHQAASEDGTGHLQVSLDPSDLLHWTTPATQPQRVDLTVHRAAVPRGAYASDLVCAVTVVPGSPPTEPTPLATPSATATPTADATVTATATTTTTVTATVTETASSPTVTVTVAGD